MESDPNKPYDLVQLELEYQEALMALTSIITQLPELAVISRMIVAQLKAGHKVLICGNGGSAAQAQHFSAELMVRYQANRRALPCIALTTDGVMLTAINNDLGADEIFSRQVAGLGQEGDVFIALSTSGNSENVHRALRTARHQNLRTVALLGRDGGAMAGLADHEIIVRREATARIQEAHLVMLHMMCQLIEKEFTVNA